ncbi:uncharacterized protein LOC135811901 [Sycon ciliatum]|uniref:uncharacterized protein LOC135811901 n=1 Tax=Sycon ciliatum TaxID=27933 RepID=UPI0031F6E29D
MARRRGTRPSLTTTTRVGLGSSLEEPMCTPSGATSSSSGLCGPAAVSAISSAILKKKEIISRSVDKVMKKVESKKKELQMPTAHVKRSSSDTSLHSGIHLKDMKEMEKATDEARLLLKWSLVKLKGKSLKKHLHFPRKVSSDSLDQLATGASLAGGSAGTPVQGAAGAFLALTSPLSPRKAHSAMCRVSASGSQLSIEGAMDSAAGQLFFPSSLQRSMSMVPTRSYALPTDSGLMGSPTGLAGRGELCRAMSCPELLLHQSKHVTELVESALNALTTGGPGTGSCLEIPGLCGDLSDIGVGMASPTTANENSDGNSRPGSSGAHSNFSDDDSGIDSRSSSAKAKAAGSKVVDGIASPVLHDIARGRPSLEKAKKAKMKNLHRFFQRVGTDSKKKSLELPTPTVKRCVSDTTISKQKYAMKELEDAINDDRLLMKWNAVKLKGKSLRKHIMPRVFHGSATNSKDTSVRHSITSSISQSSLSTLESITSMMSLKNIAFNRRSSPTLSCTLAEQSDGDAVELSLSEHDQRCGSGRVASVFLRHRSMGTLDPGSLSAAATGMSSCELSSATAPTSLGEFERPSRASVCRAMSCPEILLHSNDLKTDIVDETFIAWVRTAANSQESDSECEEDTACVGGAVETGSVSSSSSCTVVSESSAAEESKAAKRSSLNQAKKNLHRIFLRRKSTSESVRDKPLQLADTAHISVDISPDEVDGLPALEDSNDSLQDILMSPNESQQLGCFDGGGSQRNISMSSDSGSMDGDTISTASSPACIESHSRRKARSLNQALKVLRPKSRGRTPPRAVDSQECEENNDRIPSPPLVSPTGYSDAPAVVTAAPSQSTGLFNALKKRSGNPLKSRSAFKQYGSGLSQPVQRMSVGSLSDGSIDGVIHSDSTPNLPSSTTSSRSSSPVRQTSSDVQKERALSESTPRHTRSRQDSLSSSGEGSQKSTRSRGISPLVRVSKVFQDKEKTKDKEREKSGSCKEKSKDADKKKLKEKN